MHNTALSTLLLNPRLPMPLLPTTLDDASPLITYHDFPAVAPPCSACTLDDSLHVATRSGATATFTFNGPGICVFGNRSPDGGSFQMTVDGVGRTASAKSDVTAYQQSLLCLTGLANTQHQVVVTNGDGQLAIDYFTVTITQPTAGGGPNGGAIAAGVILGLIAVVSRSDSRSPRELTLPQLGLVLWYRYARYRLQGGKGSFREALFGKSRKAVVEAAEQESADTWRNWPMLRYLPTYSTRTATDVADEERKEKEKSSSSSRSRSAS